MVKKARKKLSFTDRQKIESMIRHGERVVKIAQEVGVHRATIYNELKRGGYPYEAEKAQKTL